MLSGLGFSSPTCEALQFSVRMTLHMLRVIHSGCLEVCCQELGISINHILTALRTTFMTSVVTKPSSETHRPTQDETPTGGTFVVCCRMNSYLLPHNSNEYSSSLFSKSNLVLLQLESRASRNGYEQTTAIQQCKHSYSASRFSQRRFLLFYLYDKFKYPLQWCRYYY